jgi:FkbM family methyltransferase
MHRLAKRSDKGFLVSEYFGLEQLDRVIAEHIHDPAGIFVELGAADGIKHSNTLYFERKGWRGVLIEPVPWQYECCLTNRPLAKVFNCACVPFGEEEFIEMTAVGLMSMIVGAMGGGAREAEWIARGAGLHGEPRLIRAPARTLTSVLEEAGLMSVDLLVLDVEGYEVNVLKGLEFALLPPRWIAAEDAYDDALHDYLIQQGYRMESILSERRFTRDILYSRD